MSVLLSESSTNSIPQCIRSLAICLTLLSNFSIFISHNEPLECYILDSELFVIFLHINNFLWLDYFPKLCRVSTNCPWINKMSDSFCLISEYFLKAQVYEQGLLKLVSKWMDEPHLVQGARKKWESRNQFILHLPKARKLVQMHRKMPCLSSFTIMYRRLLADGLVVMWSIM